MSRLLSICFLRCWGRERELKVYFDRAINDIRQLVEKYPDGLDAYEGERPDGA